MKIILVRHGKTQWNVEGKIQGWLDSPLLPSAIDQLKELELSVTSCPIVFSSDLARAKISAEIIASKTGSKVEIDKRLRERNFGVLQGHAIDQDSQLQPNWDRYHQRYLLKMNGVEGVELERDFEQRIRSFIADLTSYQFASEIIIVGHGEWLRAFNNIMIGEPSWHLGKGINDNAKPTVLHWSVPKEIVLNV